MSVSKTYNMKDLSQDVARRFDLTDVSGQAVVRFVFETVAEQLAEGKQVRLHKFATLEGRTRAASKARNPVTGAPIAVPATQVLKVSVSAALKQRLNGQVLAAELGI